MSVTPARGGVTLSQTITFSAAVVNDQGNAGVTWTKTGGSFGSTSTTAASFSSAAAGTFTITATSIADSSKSASATIGVTDLAGVFTQRYDSQRTGQNLQEYALTPGSVSNSTFGKLFACTVDAELYAQPLYVANLSIAGGTHNTVFVATQNDSVYAFDADTSPCVPLWNVSLLNGGTPVSPADTGETGDINTKIGITGTPVIDSLTNTLYVVSKTNESGVYHQRLHALSLVNGAEKFNGPTDINDAITVPGSGDNGDGGQCNATSGNVPFCPLHENQRPGLLLLNGFVYIAWASHGDNDPYHGWVIGYQASDLTKPPVLFNSTPNGSRGGIWMTGTGPAADAAGNIYAITGNGTFDTGTPRTNYGDSFIKLTPGLAVADFFTPANQDFLNGNDFDVGSGGAIVVDSTGTHPHLLIGGDKQGVLYVVNRDNMSGFNPGGDQILQTVPITTGPACIICGIFSTPAFWEGNLYVIAIGDVLKQYTLANSSLSLLPARQAGDTFAFPGASPAVSSTGATNGIVWAVNTSKNGTPNPGTGSGPAVLFAYDAATLTKLYSSPSSGVGTAGNAVKFVVPTVANGKVYFGTQTELSVFGLLDGSGPKVLFTDDFNRADVNPIAGNWTTSFTAGGAIVGNELTGGGGGDNFIFLNSILPPPNQYAKITFVSTGNNNNEADSGGPVVRGDASGNGWLLNVVSNDNPGDSSWTLFRVVAATGTVIARGRVGRPLVNGDVLEIRAVGSLISGYLNGIAIPGASTTDATYPTGGFGVHLFGNTGRWDNFEGGSL